MLKYRSAYTVFVRKSEGRTHLERHKAIWEYNIKINLKDGGYS
jgi:hypothetical protein